MRIRLFLALLTALLPFTLKAVSISGEIIDTHTGASLANVNILNIHTKVSAISNERGAFTMTVERGQLLEFRKIGFKTVRVRIPEGNIPLYFRILMQQGPIELPEFDLQARGKDWKKDSARYYELYKNAIEFPRLEGLDVIRHPFSALSKRNRQIWAFQKEFNFWEQQKFIDYTFNEKLVTSLTGLAGDSLQRYMRQYRPSYQQLRTMNEYTFYSYVKESVEVYRHGRSYRPVIRRSAN